jgi:hypothetical protein
VTDTPIIFSAAMVRALLDGRKDDNAAVHGAADRFRIPQWK